MVDVGERERLAAFAGGGGGELTGDGIHEKISEYVTLVGEGDVGESQVRDASGRSIRMSVPVSMWQMGKAFSPVFHDGLLLCRESAGKSSAS